MTAFLLTFAVVGSFLSAVYCLGSIIYRWDTRGDLTAPMLIRRMALMTVFLSIMMGTVSHCRKMRRPSPEPPPPTERIP